jgi:hypothetical protein
MLVREKVLDKGSVLILDIRHANPQAYDALHLFKAQSISLVKADLGALKALVHFKHVFLVGDMATDFESEDFIKLAQGFLSEEMRPFSLFLHRFKPDLVHTEYPHLCIRGNEKKKLTLYPQIIVKSKDLGLESSKQRFQILMGPSLMIKGQQLNEMNV